MLERFASTNRVPPPGREPAGPVEDRWFLCGALDVCSGGTVSVRDLICAVVPRGSARRVSESVSDGSRLRPRRLLAGRACVMPELPDMSASAERAGVGGEYPVRVEAMVGGCVQWVLCQCVPLVEWCVT